MMDSHIERLVWWNNQLLPESEARISIYDSALMFGDMIFEMTRSFNKVHFKLREHLERLYASAKYVHIDIPMSIDELEEAVHLTTEANKDAFAEDDEYRVLINVSRGLLSIYEDVIGIEKGPNVIIAIFPLRWTVRGMGKLFDTGVNLVIPSQRQIPSHLLETRVKHRSRLHYLMANIEVAGKDCEAGATNWPLLLDPDGYVTEGTYNFFIVQDDMPFTSYRNVLHGISVEYINELHFSESVDLTPFHIYNADEAFITATPFCILPVTSLNGVNIGDGKPGNVYNELLSKWSENVDINIPNQIQKWDAEGGNLKQGISPYAFK